MAGKDVGAEWQDMEEDMGFKKLTPENWLKPDSVMHAFGRLSPEGKLYVPTGEEWASVVMGIEMVEGVPLEIRRLFAVAKGALCYGYFFFPLYSLASEQLSRVAEAAVAHKYNSLGGPKRVRKTPESRPRNASFQDKLGYLRREGLITERDAIWWGAIREARNDASHPQDHRPQIPVHAVGRAEELAKRVNGLFAR